MAPADQARGPAAAWPAHAEAIREAVRQAPAATLDEHRRNVPPERFRLAPEVRAKSKFGAGGR